MLETHVAIHKEHACDSCGKRIPLDSRYFYEPETKFTEHTNCLEFEHEPFVDIAKSRTKGKVALMPL